MEDHGSLWIVWHSVISFKIQQSMAHTLPSKEFRWSRSHVEDRDRERVLVLVTCPGFPTHLSTAIEDLILTNVILDSQAGVKENGKEGNSGERQDH